jgi:hypothetical protein
MTPEQIRADYRAALHRVGEPVTIKRYYGTGSTRPFYQATVRARVTGYEPNELVGGVIQGDRKLIVSGEDIIGAGGITLPLVKGDKVIVRGRELNIEAADDSSRRVQGVLVAIELQVRG